MKRIIRNKALRVIIAAFIISCTFCSTTSRIALSNDTDTARLVVLVEPRIETVPDELPVIGRISAHRNIRVSSKVPGKIVDFEVVIGDTVKEGDVLVRLDQYERKLALQQAQASLALAESRKPQIQQARMAYENARRDYERMKKLREDNVITEQQFDGIKTKMDIAEAAYTAARSTLADIDLAETGLKLAEQQLEDTVIKSPVSGVVISRMAEPGENTGAGVPLLVLEDRASMNIEFGITETSINKVEPGQIVTFTVDISDNTYTAEIFEISPVSDPRTLSYTIKARISNKDSYLRTGAFARGRLRTGTSDALVIPAHCAFRQPAVAGKFVYVVEDNIAMLRGIEAGPIFGDLLVVNSGLDKGEAVISVGMEGLISGSEVRVTNR